MIVTLLVSLPSLFIDDSFLSYDDSLSSDSFDTSSDSSSSALSSSPYKLSNSSSSFINSSLSLYAGGGIKSAKSAYTSTAGNGTTASNIWSFSPIGSVSGDTPVAGTAGSSETSNSKTSTTTGEVIYSGTARTFGYAVSAGTTFYFVYIYGSTTVGATSGSSATALLGSDAISSSGSAATKGYVFLDESTASSFMSTLKTRVNASSSNYWYNERTGDNFYYIDSYTVTPATASTTRWIARTTGSTFTGGGSSTTTTYSTFQHLKF